MLSLSSLKSGIPYTNRPPILSDFSNTVTEWPTRQSCWAAARPAGPEPTIATFLPVLTRGGCGLTQPSSNARSAIECSICLMLTGFPLIASVHEVSQGAGHTRPVISGKLFVACSDSLAAACAPLYT